MAEANEHSPHFELLYVHPVMHQASPQRILATLQAYWSAHRAMPSFSAIASQVALSVSTVADGVAKLKEADFLKAGPTGRLQPGRRFFERQMLGRVQAGMPAEVPDVQPEGMVIDEYLVDTPEDTVLLTVKGESMRDAGLLPGDVVVVRRELQPNAGDIVVAMVDGAEMTIKQLFQTPDGHWYLHARNADFPDIYPKEQLRFIGIVIGQFRRYARNARIKRSEI
jgi:SOS-response transcriptional repressor LexA